MPDKITDPNVDIWFPDSTGINICCGAGVYEPMDNHRESIPMGSLSAVFQAEVMAILRCTELLQSKNIMRRRIHICSDSRAATAALAKTTTKLALVWDSMQALEKLSGSNIVAEYGYLGIMEYWEIKKLINCTWKGLIKLLASPLIWVKKPSGAI